MYIIHSCDVMSMCLRTTPRVFILDTHTQITNNNNNFFKQNDRNPFELNECGL